MKKHFTENIRFLVRFGENNNFFKDYNRCSSQSRTQGKFGNFPPISNKG